MEFSTVILTSAIAGFSMLGFMILFSRRPFYIPYGLPRYAGTFLAGLVLWIALLGFTHALLPFTAAATPARGYTAAIPDLICGFLVLGCAAWACYWVSNFGQGFRIHMLLDLAQQKTPVTLEQWMACFGDLGMEKFLKDRLQSILIPWKIVELDGDAVKLTPGLGRFLGAGADFLTQVLNDTRRMDGD
jgi:hypothetical protein